MEARQLQIRCCGGRQAVTSTATREAACTAKATPCTLHPAPCALHPAPCTLHPAPRCTSDAGRVDEAGVVTAGARVLPERRRVRMDPVLSSAASFSRGEAPSSCREGAGGIGTPRGVTFDVP
jgi:hypothetical protein